MKKLIQISIPTPCHEDWSQMTPADKGRFCASCQKKVFDFTNASDREIASVLKNADKACGRFTAAQLDRDLVIPKEKSSVWMAASAAVISFITLGSIEATAQNTTPTEQIELPHIVGKPLAIEQKNIIAGTIYDPSGAPLTGAIVSIINSTLEKQTDLDGNFSIEADEGSILQVSYIGFKTERITINEPKRLIITMLEDIHGLQGDIIIVRRSFFGRIFYRIGNLFR